MRFLTRAIIAPIFALTVLGVLLLPVFRAAESEGSFTPIGNPINGSSRVSAVDLDRIDVVLDRSIVLLAGAREDVPWRLVVGSNAELYCFALGLGPSPNDSLSGCSSHRGYDPVEASIFTPAPLSKGLGGSVLLAALDGGVSDVALSATDGSEVDVEAVRSPDWFEQPVVFVVAFLAPEADIGEARARTSDDRPVDISGLEDQLRAYL